MKVPYPLTTCESEHPVLAEALWKARLGLGQRDAPTESPHRPAGPPNGGVGHSLLGRRLRAKIRDWGS